MKYKRGKTIYLSGGMTGLSKEEQNKWREDMILAFGEEYHLNLFNPCKHWDVEDPSVNERAAMDYDLYRLRQSDVVVVNFNAPSSIGTAMEQSIAYELRIPIIGLNEDENRLHPWQELMCSEIFEDMDDLIDYLYDHYVYED